MRVIICDRCKAKIDCPDTIGAISLEVRGMKGTLVKAYPWKEWDLCPSCVADIAEYVEGSTCEEEEKRLKAVIKKRQPANAERIRELLGEGKGIKEIAKEVGCSEQTVRNHMKKEAADETTDSVSESDPED